jgi:hypothetical protein
LLADNFGAIEGKAPDSLAAWMRAASEKTPRDQDLEHVAEKKTRRACAAAGFRSLPYDGAFAS